MENGNGIGIGGSGGFFLTGILTHGLSNGYAETASRLPGCHFILLLSAFTHRVIVVLSWDGLGTTG